MKSRLSCTLVTLVTISLMYGLVACSGGGGGATQSQTTSTATPVLSLSSSSINFGNQVSTTTRTVTVTNSGTAGLVISNLAIAGPNAAAFAVTPGIPITVSP